METDCEQPQRPTHAFFYEYDEKYRFWCCHVRNWAKVIAVLTSIGVILSAVVLALVFDPPGSPDSTPTLDGLFIGLLVFVILSGVAVLLLIVGIAKENPYCLIPQLIFQAISCALGIVAFAMAAGAGSVRGTTIGLAARTLIEILFFWALVRCFRFYRDKRAAKAMGLTVVSSEPTEIYMAGYSNEAYDVDAAKTRTPPPYSISVAENQGLNATAPPAYGTPTADVVPPKPAPHSS